MVVEQENSRAQRREYAGNMSRGRQREVSVKREACHARRCGTGCRHMRRRADMNPETMCRCVAVDKCVGGSVQCVQVQWLVRV